MGVITGFTGGFIYAIPSCLIVPGLHVIEARKLANWLFERSKGVGLYMTLLVLLEIAFGGLVPLLTWSKMCPGILI